MTVASALLGASRAVPPTLAWTGGLRGRLRIIDQTRLPGELVEIELADPEQVWEAIRSLRVRGAPAIGVAAAYGVVLGLRDFLSADRDALEHRVQEVADFLATSRPTAVNLFWALERMKGVLRRSPTASAESLVSCLLEEAQRIEDEDRETCAAIGRHGAALLLDGMSVLTHCNAGSLATAGDGTALAVIYAAARDGKRIHVYADETRPLLQGARLTAWELMQRKIPATLLCDSAAGWLMKQGEVQAVITGADRIAANGDVANKIGTYSVAVLARAHSIPFYVAAPASTFDLARADGSGIPIEERPTSEVTCAFGQPSAPQGIAARNPAFDVTPAGLVTALITERGLIQPVTADNVRKVIGR